MLKQAVFPAFQVRTGPVAINAFDARYAIVGYFREQPGDDLRRCIITVDEKRECVGKPSVCFSSRARGGSPVSFAASAAASSFASGSRCGSSTVAICSGRVPVAGNTTPG